MATELDNEKDAGDIEVARVQSAYPDDEKAVAAGEPQDVWGEINENGPNYRNLGWIRASVLMIKYQIGLGVLGIPYILHTFGFVPGIIIICVVAVVTSWADYVVGIFKMQYPEVYSLADVCFIMWGPIGREISGFFFWLAGTAVAGAGLVGISTAFNAVSEHAMCTVAWVVVSSVIVVAIASVQTLDRISWLGWVGVAGIMSSVITLAVAVGVQDRPSAAPPTGPWSTGVRTSANPGFMDAITAVCACVFAYAGAPNFLNIAAELRRPKDYTKALILCQVLTTVTYLVVGSVVYHFCGQYVASPALGSAGPLLKKVCYGLALPGLIVGAVICTHLPAKFLFVRFMRNSRHLSENTMTHRIVWGTCVVGNCIVSFIIAEAVPVFGDLLSLLGALCSIPMAIGLECVMWIWLSMHNGRQRNARTLVLYAINGVVVLACAFMTVAGIYSAVMSINTHVKEGKTTQPFSCIDNS